jgi:hypothetical protein
LRGPCVRYAAALDAHFTAKLAVLIEFAFLAVVDDAISADGEKVICFRFAYAGVGIAYAARAALFPSGVWFTLFPRFPLNPPIPAESYVHAPARIVAHKVWIAP